MAHHQRRQIIDGSMHGDSYLPIDLMRLRNVSKAFNGPTAGKAGAKGSSEYKEILLHQHIRLILSNLIRTVAKEITVPVFMHMILLLRSSSSAASVFDFVLNSHAI